MRTGPERARFVVAQAARALAARQGLAVIPVETPAFVRPPVPLRPLSERLRALVRNHCADVAICSAFLAGGKLHGVGIASDLYCVSCGHARMWHDVAEAAVIIAAGEEVEHGA